MNHKLLENHFVIKVNNDLLSFNYQPIFIIHKNTFMTEYSQEIVLIMHIKTYCISEASINFNKTIMTI